jgi:quercetin dioxygenase-like cupin family protein
LDKIFLAGDARFVHAPQAFREVTNPMPNKTISARERASWPRGVRIKLEKPFVDRRGTIQPLVDVDMAGALLITSKKGSIRANHYHKSDWHYCYVLEGAIDYFHRPVGSRRKPTKVRIRKGELFFTPPMIEHAMVFPVDTVFLTLSRNKRDQKHYERDLVRVELVK